LNHAQLINLSEIEEGGASDARGPGMTSPAAIKKDVAMLVASITEHGLLQPLLVRKTAGDIPGEARKYRVIAGNRRLRALRIIHGKKNVEVSVIITEASDEDAFEKSLAENVIRQQMHPVDEFTAFAALVKAGWSPEQVAKRFGLTERLVRQRMQLERLSPNLRSAWRLGTMTADQAAALTIADEHALQEKIWAGAKKNEWASRPENLRKEIRLATQGLLENDSQVKFIGLDAYFAAGGEILHDLFSDQKTLISVDLITKMVDERIAQECAALIAEGWSFALPETAEYWDYETLDVTPWMSADDAAIYRKNPHNSTSYALEKAAIALAMADPAARAKSGCIVGRDHLGGFDVTGLVLPPTAAEGAGAVDKSVDPGVDEPSPPDAKPQEPAAEPPKVNWALRETMSERLTLALSEALALDPHAACAALAASLRHAMTSHGGGSPLRVQTREAWAALNTERTAGGAKEWQADFTRLVNMGPTELAGELAALSVKLVDLRAPKVDSRGYEYSEGRDALIRVISCELPVSALGAAIDKHFDREAYFIRLTVDELHTALTEMRAPAKRPARKARLAALAATLAKETGWLPVDLRLSGLMALKTTP
jgi:ParB family chromosome partitioning protein